jgi:hypothetical protein
VTLQNFFVSGVIFYIQFCLAKRTKDRHVVMSLSPTEGSLKTAGTATTTGTPALAGMPSTARTPKTTSVTPEMTKHQ